MGVIKDGEVSGIIPNKEAFAVHYPGYPSSMSRAIQTLGGADAILKARSSQSNKLELYFRPEDPYSHPASGELRACNNLLLKLSKKKNKDESESQVHHVEELSADIVAHIHEAYHFDGMVDYQHVVAVHADAAAQKKKRNWTEMEEEPRFGKAGFMGMDQEDVMILVPPLFTMKDMPANLALKPTSNPSLKNKSEEAMENHFEMNLEPALAIDFTIKDILDILFVLLDLFSLCNDFCCVNKFSVFTFLFWTSAFRVNLENLLHLLAIAGEFWYALLPVAAKAMKFKRC